jgi:hypothetical protein
MTVGLRSHVFFVCCLIVEVGSALPTDWGNPFALFGLKQQKLADIKEFVALIVAIAAWVKGHQNLFIAPSDVNKSSISGTEVIVHYVRAEKP